MNGVLKEIKKKSEAYLYKVTVKSTKKMYIGWHKGKSDGTYYHSSKCPIFAKDFAKNDNEYEILEYGTCQEMATKENEMLKEVDAKNNEDYYNKSNGGGLYVKKTKYKGIIQLYKDMMNKKFAVVIVDKTTIKDVPRFQVRVANTDPEHLKILVDAMMDLHGDLSDWEPVHILKDFYGKDKDLMINGNHTTISANKVSHVVDMPVMFIPKEVWSQFDEIELIDLANLLNPQPKKAAKKSDKEDWIQNIVNKYNKKGIAVDSQENQTLLKVNNYSTRQINGIVEKAKDEVEDAKLIPPGFQLKLYTDKELKEITDAASDKDTVSYVSSSANFDIDQLFDKFDAIIDGKLPKRYVNVYIKHPSMKSQKEWKKKWSAKAEKRLSRSSNYGGVTFYVNLIELDYLEKNTL